MAYPPTQQRPAAGLEDCRSSKEFEMLKTYVIEGEIAGVGRLTSVQIGEVARTSNAALAKIDGAQWQHSDVTSDKTFCVHLAQK
jgi:Protein of unknown function (DUF4242)